ncbi:hypothetical protein [Vibrio lentus]|uniref:hypothetical protein n=1 Tax=Vibrio lentus TaxID=136468 RepID=UPI001054C7E9|nr:hypothetical protein [Vibrio lentus]
MDRVKTMFWCREVFLRLGIDDPGQLSMTKSNEDNLLSISNKLEAKDQDLVFELFLSGADNPKWEKYFYGERVPANTSNGRSKNRPIRSLVNLVFKGTESYFDNGPYGIFRVLSCDNFNKAVENLTLACEKFFKANDINCPRGTEGGKGYITWDVSVVTNLTDKSDWNFEEIQRYLFNLTVYYYDDHIPELLLLSIAAAKIQSRFLQSQRFMDILGSDPEFSGRETGLEAMERSFGVDRRVWLNL